MELAMSLLLLIFALMSLCLLIIRRAFLLHSPASHVPPLPPGPTALPIIGHLHLLGRLPHHSLATLSRTYGPLLSLRFGSLPAVVVSSPSMAKLFLHTHDKIFAGRPQNFTVPRNALALTPDIAFSLPGPYWKFMRQLCFTHFLGAKHLNSCKLVRMQEVRSLMHSIWAAQGTAISIREKLHRTSMNVISRMMLSRRLQEISEDIGKSEHMMAAVMGLFGMLGDFNVSDFIPCVAWMDLQGYDRRSKRLACINTAFFQHVIDKRRSEGSSDDASPRDFLDILLLASMDAKNSHFQIGDANIRAIIIDMFSAGTDTSTVATEWALAELLSNPQILKNLQDELDEIVGCSRLVQETDLPNLPYLQAVVNESLRLHSVAPLLVPHMSMEASQVSGYHIPKHTLVYINAWAIHRDPSIWENPLKFSPERFLNCDLDELARQCKFLPFGAGRRICPGATLGLLNAQILLANLVHAFNWQILACKLEMKEKFGLTLKLDEPLVIVPMPRLPPSLLETFV